MCNLSGDTRGLETDCEQWRTENKPEERIIGEQSAYLVILMWMRLSSIYSLQLVWGNNRSLCVELTGMKVCEVQLSLAISS